MKRYIIRKYVMAKSPADAYRLEKKVNAEEVWLDEKQPDPPSSTHAIGFNMEESSDYYSPIAKKPRSLTNKRMKKMTMKRPVKDRALRVKTTPSKASSKTTKVRKLKK